jgi:DNA-binding transcriptional LysR family regulator
MTPFQGKLRIRHLEIVLAVAGFGTLSKAAVQLNMTQPGLSRALVDIEECVGGTVFERTAKGMRPTALGQALCRHADAILGDLHKAETDLAAVARGKVGSLRVGCFSMFSSWPLSDAVRRFRASHPAISLSVEIGRHEKLIEDMDAGSLDILISRYPPNLNPEVYRAMPFLTDGAVLTCSPAHPLVRAPTVSLEDCVRYPWITAPSDSRIQIELETKLRHLGLSFSPGVAICSACPWTWGLPETHLPPSGGGTSPVHDMFGLSLRPQRKASGQHIFLASNPIHRHADCAWIYTLPSWLVPSV